MSSFSFSPQNQQAMIAVMVSPDLSPSDFHPRYGVTFENMKKILRNLKTVDDPHDEEVYLAINGCLNEACYGIVFDDDPDVIGMTSEEWPLWFPVSKDDLRDLYRRWRAKNKRDLEP